MSVKINTSKVDTNSFKPEERFRLLSYFDCVHVSEDTLDDTLLTSGTISMEQYNGLKKNWKIDSLEMLHKACLSDAIATLNHKMIEDLLKNVNDLGTITLRKLISSIKNSQFLINNINISIDMMDQQISPIDSVVQDTVEYPTNIYKYGSLNNISLYCNPVLASDNREAIFCEFNKEDVKFEYDPNMFFIFVDSIGDDGIKSELHCKYKLTVSDNVKSYKAIIKKFTSSKSK